MYRVLELASHSDMELESKIQYIIDGIKDEETHKSILYGASTIKELRQKLKQYETQLINRNKTKQSTFNKKKNQGTAHLSDKGSTDVTTSRKSERRCFNCGYLNHIGKDCPNKSKGLKCYTCGEFGHVAAECSKSPKMTSKNPATRVDALQTGNDKKTYKAVNILGKDTIAVIDRRKRSTFDAFQFLCAVRCSCNPTGNNKIQWSRFNGTENLRTLHGKSTNK